MDVGTLHTWQNDPLLINQTPTNVDNWTTANKLIQQERPNRLYLIPNTLNLYGVLIKKADFIRRTDRDRIFARMPYVQLRGSLRSLIEERFETLGQKVCHYLEGIYTANAAYFKNILQNYLHQERLPLVILRVLAELTSNPRESLATWLLHAAWESFKHIPFRMPALLTPQLVYFLGVCNGDGSLTRTHISISDYYPTFIQKLHTFTATMFGGHPTISQGSGGVNILFIKSVWVGRLLNFLTDQPYGRKYHALRCPLILANTELERFYWRGLFDTDGSYQQTMQFGTVSDQLAHDLERFLTQHALTYCSYFSPIANTIQLKLGSYKAFAHLVGSWHPDKQQHCLKLLRQGTRIVMFKGVKSNCLTAQGYLNLALLPKLHAEIENQRVRVLHLLTRFGEDTYSYLLAHNTKFVYPRADRPIRLPLKPTKQVTTLLKYLSPTQDGIAVTTGKYRGHYRDLVQTVVEVHKLFGFYSLRRANGGYKAQHKLLRDFLCTFFVYEPAWLPTTRDEETNLVESWNSFLCKNSD